MILEHFFGFLQGKRHGAKKAMRDLEISLRAKDPVTPVEDTLHYSTIVGANVEFLLSFVGSASLVWFATRQVPKYLGLRPFPKLLALSYSFGKSRGFSPATDPVNKAAVRSRLYLDASHRAALSCHGDESCLRQCSVSFIMHGGCAQIYGGMVYYGHYHGSATHVLEGGEEHMKMELAKIILNNHSTDELLVEAVKRHFIAENLFSDQQQEQQLFRWRQRNSFVDCSFMERMKEYEANNSDDYEAESSVNTRLFEEDSLACILGTPGNSTEMSEPPEHTGGTVLTRGEVHAHGRSHRHRRRAHADKAAVL